MPATAKWASTQPIRELALLLHRWTDGTLIIVGSGGSYSAASAWAQFHSQASGRPALASTPMGLTALVSAYHDCRILLLSAEGKNSDILNAARLAKALDIPCAAITLTGDNALTRFADSDASLYSFAFNMDWGKDGYLATNTLLAIVLLAGKTYFEVTESAFSKVLSMQAIEAQREHWQTILGLRHATQAGVLLLHGPQSALFATDLESKLTEAALAQCQVVDYRQFAHGRHLQLAKPPQRVPLVLAAFTSSEASLAKAMTTLFPEGLAQFDIPISGSTILEQAIASLVAAYLVTEAIGRHAQIDPGQPDVPNFGRKIYALDSSAFWQIPDVPSIIEVAARRKVGNAALEPNGWPVVMTAARQYLEKINRSPFQILICDFDGTLCHAHERFNGINSAVTRRLTELLNMGLYLGIATGRGDSVVKNLRDVLPKALWQQVWVGLYSGSVVMRLDHEFLQPVADPQLDEAIKWLHDSVLRRYALDCADKRRAGQLSLRIDDQSVAQRVAQALAVWILETGRVGWRVFSSGHSVDLLAPSASKRNVASHVMGELGATVRADALYIGDAGHAGGNDYELLRNSLSLSADRVSDSLSCCWNLAPAGMRQADATAYYLNAISAVKDGFQTQLPSGNK